jgi:hypothetical protein
MTEEDEDESTHMDTDKTDEEAQDASLAFDNDLDSEVINFTIEEDDRVFMAVVHLVDPHHFVRASSTVSGRVRGHLSISLPYLLYSLLPSSTLSTPTPLCAYVHIITKGRRPLSPIVDDSRILKSLTLDFHLCSHLSHLGQASDTWGHVHEILRHPLRHVDLG